MMRGEGWWAELAGESGFRPVAIISRSEGLAIRRILIIAEVTRAIRHLPCEVPMGSDEGMPTACVINTDNLHTIPKDRLRSRMTMLSPENLFALGNALRFSLDLEW